MTTLSSAEVVQRFRAAVTNAGGATEFVRLNIGAYPNLDASKVAAAFRSDGIPGREVLKAIGVKPDAVWELAE